MPFERWNLWVVLICHDTLPPVDAEKPSIIQKPSLLQEFLQVWIAAVKVVDNDKQLSQMLLVRSVFRIY